MNLLDCRRQPSRASVTNMYANVRPLRLRPSSEAWRQSPVKDADRVGTGSCIPNLMTVHELAVRLQPAYRVTVSSAWRSAAELSPTQTSNTPGSTTQRFACGLKNCSSSRPSRKCTILVSPGCSVTRLNPSS